MSAINPSDVTRLFSGLNPSFARNNASVALVLASEVSGAYQPGQTGKSSLLDSLGNKNTASPFGVASTPPAPDWDGFLTKRNAEMTEDEYVAAIKEQARADREAGVYQKSQGFNSLKMSYVSVVSPDREAIVDKANAAAAGGKTQGLLSQFGQYKDSKGQTVAMYGAQFGWMMMNTDEEKARSTKFLEIYNAAYQESGEDGETDTGEEPVQQEGGGLDVQA